MTEDTERKKKMLEETEERGCIDHLGKKQFGSRGSAALWRKLFNRTDVCQHRN
ncbi:hypothetical protein NQZ68_015675 [Dissostichus eleginoides]|nr:hypothetical protein NQZ68_015675 [Dissostichus eleginoides]